MIKKQSGNSQGFTIVELLIATAVFSGVLLIALGGFIQIGRLFYKGLAQSQTQEVAQQIMSDVKANIQTAASVSPSQAGGGYNYYCIGGARYTFNLTKIVDSSSTDLSAGGNYGLLKDSLPGDSACAAPCAAAPCPPTSNAYPFTKATDFLGDSMQLTAFSITPIASNPHLYSVKITVAYGNPDLFGYTDTSNPPNPSTIYCKGGNGDQFCAVHSLSSQVLRGLNL